jgi:hypothetical protein
MAPSIHRLIPRHSACLPPETRDQRWPSCQCTTATHSPPAVPARGIISPLVEQPRQYSAPRWGQTERQNPSTDTIPLLCGTTGKPRLFSGVNFHLFGSQTQTRRSEFDSSHSASPRTSNLPPAPATTLLLPGAGERHRCRYAQAPSPRSRCARTAGTIRPIRTKPSEGQSTRETENVATSICATPGCRARRQRTLSRVTASPPHRHASSDLPRRGAANPLQRTPAPFRAQASDILRKTSTPIRALDRPPPLLARFLARQGNETPRTRANASKQPLRAVTHLPPAACRPSRDHPGPFPFPAPANTRSKQLLRDATHLPSATALSLGARPPAHAQRGRTHHCQSHRSHPRQIREGNQRDRIGPMDARGASRGVEPSARATDQASGGESDAASAGVRGGGGSDGRCRWCITRNPFRGVFYR